MAETPDEAYKSLSSLASLVKRTVPELNALMEGPAQSIGTSRPSLQTVIQYIAVGERDGKQTYTSAFPNRVNWKEPDYYAELLEQNCKNRHGLFFGSATVNKDAAYEILWQIIRRLIDNSRTSRHVPFSAAPSDSPAVVVHPLVVFWKNVDDREHGWYYEGNQPDEAIFYAKDPTEYATLAVLKDTISAYFQLHIPGRVIAKLYRVRYTDSGVPSVVATIRSLCFWRRDPLEQKRTFYDEDDNQPEDDLDPHDPASVSEIFLTNMELRDKMDEAYVTMIQERETNDITLQDRFGQYTTLVGIASMINGSPVGDVAMQRDGNDEEAVIEAANGSSLAWAMELTGTEDDAAGTQPASALGSKLFGEITEEEVKAFRDRERWTDNIKFQREDFEGSCK
ncbi:hypothetical protein GP486_000361 [Trichoglossum hirsutum]|uniref:Uncharacterized protein n=1 Tax=Trichoglossum hirsutum TaxID=265104 RepID=A0A9P8LIY1_9PEZI|nr:hypothetical protein GP486_000361 [Trichoglossum hirsutum]